MIQNFLLTGLNHFKRASSRREFEELLKFRTGVKSTVITSTHSLSSGSTSTTVRQPMIDLIRGAAVVMMIIFHAAFDFSGFGFFKMSLFRFGTCFRA